MVQLPADFASSATLRLLNDINPWDEGCPRYHLYEIVLRPILSKQAATMGEVLKLAKDAGIRFARSPGQVQTHLKWLFTWDGLYLE